MLRGVAVVTSAGNEGQARHHYSGQVSQNDAKVEVKVGESEYGFTMELWGLAPNRYYVDIESPSGQKNVSSLIKFVIGSHRSNSRFPTPSSLT